MTTKNVDISGAIILIYSNRLQKYVDRTDSVSRIDIGYYKYDSKYIVYYKSTDEDGKKRYNYRIEAVQILYKIKDVDTTKYYIYIDGNRREPTKLELFDHGYYRVTNEKGRVFTTPNVHFVEIGQTKDIFSYFKDIASYALNITEEDEPLHFLARNYERINYNAMSVLHNYFDGRNEKTPRDDKQIIVPFSYNQSQSKAIHVALQNKISVIEGPPGTGKTQTILNLIANILANGKNCAIVSNNNTATQNIIDKMNEVGYGFVIAQLGSQAKSTEFFQSQTDDELNNFMNQYVPSPRKDYLSNIEYYGRQLRFVNELEVSLSKHKEELRWVETEEKNQKISLDENVQVRTDLSSTKYKSLINLLSEDRKLHLLERLRIRFTYKIKKFKITGLNSNLLDTLEGLFYKARKEELEKTIDKERRGLEARNKTYLLNKISEASLIVLKQAVHDHYSKVDKKSFYADSYKRDFKSFTERYPVIASTTHSILNNTPNGYMFDCIIVDEASQADLLSSVLAMNCTRKIVVIGDSKQLQQIDEDRLLNESKRLATERNIPEAYVYNGTNSILKSIKTVIPDVPTTLLREHYRCAPDIIRFCNEMFYDGQLIPLTENSSNEQNINLIKTVLGNHARKNMNGSGLYNQREIDEVVSLIKNWPIDSYGVVTPFVIQSEMIKRAINNEDAPVSTIHKFQGQQKDKIVISFVVNSLEKPDVLVENRLYDFVTNAKLLNVAISRAKNNLYVIVSDGVYNSKNNIIHDFIRYIENLYGSNSTRTSIICSVFDYLYGDNNDYIKKLMLKRRDEQTNASEILMSNLIDEILPNYKNIKYIMHFRLSKLTPKLESLNKDEMKYIKNPLSHVDFLFYNKITKEPLFVIEIDGIKYHEQNESQLDHDRVKDYALAMNGIPVHRFKTNESGEKEKLENILKEYTNY